ncbi:MAG TPA: DUF2851 family protein [Flavobacterium sp.]|nr:DUF2851 family protein [Flavobacterium sp.]
MREDFLHYVWRYSKFDAHSLTTVDGKDLAIVHPGQYLQVAGPDFFNAQIVLDRQKWAGNIEIHLKSSDWYAHRHETDRAYDSVILHVVWEHDTPVFRADQTEIPTLELRGRVPSSTLLRYNQLLVPKEWIYCERQIADVDAFHFSAWLERLFFERLERKSLQIRSWPEYQAGDWEAVLFRMLARTFGLNQNGEIFFAMSGLLPFAVVRKEADDPTRLEALFMGLCGMLEGEKEDQYFKNLKGEFAYLSTKYRLPPPVSESVHFFKLRPDNFPTIRLSQLAWLYHRSSHLFTSVMLATSGRELRTLLKSQTTPYWGTHYLFDRPSPQRRKGLSDSFIDLVIINSIVPLRFLYGQAKGDLPDEDLIVLLRELKPERNVVVDRFGKLGIVAADAFETQALLELKTSFCARGRCLECTVGHQLLRTE